MSKLYPGQLRTMKDGLLKEKNLLTLIKEAIELDDVTQLNYEIKRIEGEVGEIVTKQRNKDYR